MNKQRDRLTSWKASWSEECDENGDRIGSWCSAHKTDQYKAVCVVCTKEILVKTSGISCLKSHSLSSQHQSLMKAKKNVTPLTSVFVKTVPSATSTPANADKALMAEIRYALHIVEQNQSFLSAHHCVELFRTMFSDSQLPQLMSLKEGKLAYVITDGIYPYVNKLLSEELCN